ncbi:MAG: hypothetical protein E7387_05270 [Ruminococcaceae bacterium]|nr:hypothetical protein [Oscillospiraceae bacterium]
MNTVYLDVLIAENTLMNFVILHITAKITSQSPRKIRLLIGAGVGTVYAVLALFVETFFTAFAGKLLLSAVMVFVVFIPKKIKDFLRYSLFFYAVTFLFAGLSFALVLSGSTKAVSNILITACVGYLMIEAILKFIKKYIKTGKIFASVYIQFDKEEKEGVWLPAIVDTGNSLRDPFSGEPVIVAEVSAFKEIIPNEICDLIHENNLEDITKHLASANSTQWIKRLRLIPYKAVGTENGMMTGFKADVVRIREGGEQEKNKDNELSGIVICLCAETVFENEEYKALLASEMIA